MISDFQPFSNVALPSAAGPDPIASFAKTASSAVREQMEAQLFEWNGAVIKKLRTAARHNENHVTLQLVKGEWPDDETMLAMADGYLPPDRCHFGGTVSRGTDLAEVVVYTD